MKKKPQPNFDEYFGSLYGDRWGALREALQAKVTRSVSIAPESSSGTEDRKPLLKQAGLVVLEGRVEGLYQLDFASVLCALQLPVHQGERFLDLCAAPGGKSLVSIFRTHGKASCVLNDVSQARLLRLKSVIKEFSGSYDTGAVVFHKRDAGLWGLNEPDSYDAILCDVPCSSEAHGKAKEKDAKPWSLKTVKTLSQRQLAILCSGFDALRVGGHLVYSTCSINPMENDAVVERLHKKRKDCFEVVTSDPPIEGSEKTQFGVQIFPDRTGMGPIYYSLIKKTK